MCSPPPCGRLSHMARPLAERSRRPRPEERAGRGDATRSAAHSARLEGRGRPRASRRIAARPCLWKPTSPPRAAMLFSVRPNEAVFASVGVEKSCAIALALVGRGWRWGLCDRRVHVAKRITPSPALPHPNSGLPELGTLGCRSRIYPTSAGGGSRPSLRLAWIPSQRNTL
jgi:hypothetical protein